jgi:hypothetical protein
MAILRIFVLRKWTGTSVPAYKYLGYIGTGQTTV